MENHNLTTTDFLIVKNDNKNLDNYNIVTAIIKYHFKIKMSIKWVFEIYLKYI